MDSVLACEMWFFQVFHVLGRLCFMGGEAFCCSSLGLLWIARVVAVGDVSFVVGEL